MALAIRRNGTNRRWIVFLAGVLLGVAALQGFTADEYYITTVAGTGMEGYSGDGGPAIKATFDFRCNNLLVDDSGVLYIVDGGNSRIRKVDRSGIVTTIAGNGVAGFLGDGGPATEASLAGPYSVEFDRAGNMYIADNGNHRIRKVDAAGIITTIAGTGKQGHSGDGGPATKAELTGPGDLSFDSAGNLYFSEHVDLGISGQVIRRIDTNGIITTFAGTGDRGDKGDGGPATKANLDHPQCNCFDRQGNLYIAESGGNRIRKVDTSGIISTVVSTKIDHGALALLLWPVGVAVDAEGNIFIANSMRNTIYRVDPKGNVRIIAGISDVAGYSGDGGPALEAKLSGPCCLSVAKDRTIYFTECENTNIVRKLYRP